jgi:hypothetical protein
MSVKVAYKLEVDATGFPPVSVELLNAKPMTSELFRIENAPFFASEVSFGDLVRARSTDVEGQLLFSEVVTASDYTSVSIILLDSSLDVFLMDFLRGLECVIEYGEFGSFRMVAVAVPANTNYLVIRAQLVVFEAQSKLSFAELAVAHKRPAQ